MAETFMAEEGLSQSQKIREDVTFCLIGGDLAQSYIENETKNMHSV